MSIAIARKCSKDSVSHGAQNISMFNNLIIPEPGSICKPEVKSNHPGNEAFFTLNEDFNDSGIAAYLGGQSTQAAFHNPSANLLNTPPNFPVSDARLCQNNQYAQALPPGAIAPASHLNPHVEFFENESEFPQNFADDGGTLIVYRRGDRLVEVDSNLVATANSDLACYQVPECPIETRRRKGRCFCMGLDFTNGFPPASNWHEISPCLQKVACPDINTDGEFDESLALDETEEYILWQFNSTEAFSGIRHPKFVPMEFNHGVCNP